MVVIAALLLVMQLGGAVPAVTAGAEPPQLSPTLEDPTRGQRPVVPEPLSSDERRDLVAELIAESASADEPAVGDGETLQAVPDVPGAFVVIDEPKVADPATNDDPGPEAAVAATPDPPYEVGWRDPTQPLGPTTVYWGARWSYASGSYAEWYGWYRASDDVLLQSSCTARSNPWTIGGGFGWYINSGLFLGVGEGAYVKVAVAATGVPENSGQQDKSCGIDWSEEAVSPVFEAIGGDSWLHPSEELGCGYENVTNRPCVQEFRGDPINTATGSLAEVAVDAEVPGPGVNFRMMRTYSSASTAQGALGQGWSSSYALSLSVAEDEVVLRAEDGSYAYFRNDGDGQWSPRSVGVQALLVGAPDTGFTLTTTDHETLTFTGDGRLVEWSDRSGIGLSFTYVDGQLAAITDGVGRTVNLTYDPSTDLLTRVSLADGRWVGYSYSSGRLASVQNLSGSITQYGYDAQGRLSSITDANGDVIMQTQYNPSTGRVISQVDAAGATSSIYYSYYGQNYWYTDFVDGNGGWWTDIYEGSVLAWQINPHGNVLGYTYDYDSRTLKPFRARDPNGGFTMATYDERGNMLTRTAPEPLDYTETWTYDEAGNITSYVDGRGNTATYTYDSYNRVVSETDPLAGMTAYTYTALGRVASVTTPAGRTTQYAYDSEGNLTSITSPSGATTTYTYDSAGRMLSRTDPRGNADGADPADYTTTYTYDDAGNVTSVTDPLGATASYTHDAVGNRTGVTDSAGNTTSYEYDAAGRLVAVTDPLGNTTAMAYDLASNLIAATDPTGATTTHTYDAANRLVATTSPLGNVDGADPAEFTYAYAYDQAGNLISVTDPAGAVTQTTYDALGRPATVTDPLGAVTEYGYNAADNLVSRTDPAGAVYQWNVDPNGQVIEATDPLGHVTSYGYDADGLQVSQVSPTGNETTWDYDADGRVVAVTDPRGNVPGASPADFTTQLAYDEVGNRTEVSDPLGRSVVFEYDAANRLTALVDPAGNSTTYGYHPVGTVAQVTTATGAATGYGYDAAGRLTTVTNPAGDSYSYAYDAAGRLTTATTPTGRAISYTYTADGQPETVSMPSGSISRSYDQLGRTTGVSFSDASPDLTYTYDAAGRLTSASNGTTTAEHGYDAVGRVTGITRGAQELVYGWDLAGRLTQRTFPDGRVQDYTWGDDSRLESTTLTTPAGHSAGEVSLSYTYDPAGYLTEVTHDGDTHPRRTYSYDEAGQVVELTHGSGLSPDALISQAIEWDLVGLPSLVETTRATDTTTSIYVYDADGQVDSVCLAADGVSCGSGDTMVEYGYDLNGNRVSTTTNSGTTTYTYDADDRPLTQGVDGTVTTFSYDGNGNLASQTGPDGTRTFTYGLDRNLYGASLESGLAIGYGYDESGNRVSRTVDATVDATWTWDTLGMPTRLDESGGSGTLRHEWWPDPQTDLGTAVADTASGAFEWLLGDYQGTITDVAGSSLTGSATLDPFGDALATSGDYADNPLRFHGQYLDQTTGLYDFRARDYQADTGRFTSPDPVAAPLGSSFINTYHYGYNQPTSLTDPTGQCAIVCTAIVGAVVGAAVGGIDCLLSGDDASTCAAKVGTGAVIGAVAGATLGVAAGAGLGAWGTVGVAATVGGLENAGYQSGVAYATSQPYGWDDLGRDLALGAGAGLVGAGIGEAAVRAGRLGIDCLLPPIQAGRGTDPAADALETAISRGRVNRNAPTNHLNGAIAEELGWQHALQNLRHIGIHPPGRVTATGPDYITFDANRGIIYVWDAKYSQTGRSFPAGDVVPAATLGRWSPWIRSAVNSYSGQGANDVKAALAAGRVQGWYFKYP